MAKRIDVICVGAAIVDIPLQPVSRDIFEIESYPIERIAMTTGGDAINESVILSRMGHSVALVSKVGRDVAGDFVLEACKKENIDTQFIQVDEKVDTSINIGLVTGDGERTFITNKNGSLWKLTGKDVDISPIENAKVLSMASIFNSPLIKGEDLVSLFRKAKEKDLIICADVIKPRLNETLKDISEALFYVDYFFPNYDEAKLLTGETELGAIADVFLKCGVKHVVIKNGKAGCFIKTKERVLEVPAVKGINAIDTIGAGDNFVAGFITALLDGKSVHECAKFGNATAAISVQSIGATSGVKDRGAVDKLYERLTGTGDEKN